LYVEDVHVGSTVEVIARGRRCTFVIRTLPASTGSVPDLGDVVCESTEQGAPLNSEP
jgi:hypothetical protein